MKKIYLLPALVLLFTLASCGLDEKEAMMEKTEEDTMMKEEAMIEDKTMIEASGSEAMMKTEEDAMMKTSGEETMMKEEATMVPGSYTAYSLDMLGKTENTVLFFHANWCPSCRAADAGISARTVPENLTILKADYDSETELKKKYGVVSQHTFVLVDAQGELIKKWVGGTSVEDITEKL